jgi:hypothetical protein
MRRSLTGRVVAAVFESGETRQQRLDDFLAVLVDEIVDVSKDTTHCEKVSGNAA